MSHRKTKTFLDNLYETFNRRGFVSPDPLQFLYAYDDADDREIAALVASTLAYGRVAQILKSLAAVFEKLGTSPSRFLRHTPPAKLHAKFSGFKHRFTTAAELCGLLTAVQEIIAGHGSLRACFSAGMRPGDETVIPALSAFVAALQQAAGRLESFTLPVPCRGSACKRLHLFLRWMVRCDEVDPGGWEGVLPSMLVIPLDTHMYRMGRAFGFTRRRQADLKAALEVTAGFRRFAPEDPVRYDFALTRFGIRNDFNAGDVLGAIKQIRNAGQSDVALY